ncbi:ArsR/SmtB family transcription factor [Marinicella litoralis]|uniref:ArsR family transcriptional regulator /transcriptional regulator n=1 Tax=Marinicella litoralis TaxID=644220 RepID=A0A4R6XGY6_9GAMM|nr:metalloregulator ArsR/SmtB family transcription factor [Marinicella litoralis]TDR17549.1 ArsR family transcriptional regulator /transcriptional regulator [Marinicella litoralis]
MNLNDLFKTLADESRIRLILLLQQQELTVAELAEITRLAQPRVSTHLSHLKKNHLVQVRKQGVSSFYRLNSNQFDSDYSGILDMVIKHYAGHPLIAQDNKQLSLVMSSQAASNQWVDSVAGDMERHYSPGRTWEATTRVVAKLVSLGHVLDLGSGDGVLAELLAKNSQQYTCVDNNAKAIEAAKFRLKHLDNVHFRQCDIHELPFKDNQFDCVLMLHVLTYSTRPEEVIKQAYQVCKPGGQLIISTLQKHNHESVKVDYGHKNLGFEADQLNQWCTAAGFSQIDAVISSQEQRKPHFKIVTVEANK